LHEAASFGNYSRRENGWVSVGLNKRGEADNLKWFIAAAINGVDALSHDAVEK